ncbi:CREB-regulated transcription coactivator 2 isoform X1 [Ictalurus punctatus]|uniref:CREB-regulated transcription coactivator 2 isoform X1 n=1 Tax=Ictalurus punctatus TaxID=7998 RepID=A0A2D0PUU7_ICTPU|nr:CREB-regulated transcription coactivator 2 isoform X1 [Ictalurus punctatus]
MNLTGAAIGAAGRGQWSGSGSASLTCNPRKFSEKIALQIQRQAADTAAFQEVMMDITSTRIQAQKVRQAQSLASYYGGSLPNVSQISAYPTGNQSQFLSNPDYSVTQLHHVRTEHGQRDHRPSIHGRPNRRHIDSAPYLSAHLSPPSGPSWRRNWFIRSANEKSQMDQTPMTALSRTRSDSALHTSVRMIYSGDPNPEQVLTGCSNKTGTPLFSPPVPLIEENVQEEGRTAKLQKHISSKLEWGQQKAGKVSVTKKKQESVPTFIGIGAVKELANCIVISIISQIPSTLSGCDTAGNHISGSLPDLSSLCLPSAAPDASNLQPPTNTNPISSSTGVHHLPSSAAHEVSTDSDCPLPCLLSSLQALVGNPLLQSSLSNPNLQTTLSSPSLHDSLSSTSLCTSLSSSSLKSSLSSQSLRSSVSSLSLSNQSFQSTASSCSYSSGIGASRSCSSSSLSCSPRTSGQVTVSHTTSSVRRSQLSPLMVPSGEELLWQQPTLSPTLSCITQGVALNSAKLRQEVKPPPYPYSQFPLTGTPKVHNSSQSWQLHQSEGCRQNTRWCQQQGSKLLSSQCKPQPHYMQLQNRQCQTQDSLLSPYHYTPQQQLDKHTPHAPQQYQQTQSNQQSQQQPINCAQTQQYLQQQTQQFPPQYQQQYQQLNQCWNHEIHLINDNQNPLHCQSKDEIPQNQQPLHHQTVLAAQDECTSWNNPLNRQNVPDMRRQRSLGTYMHLKERPKLQSKKLVQETERGRAHSSKPVHSQKALQFNKMASTSSPDNKFGLRNKSYVGLHLTPSQTEALSQKLGQLHKVTRNSDSKCQDVEGKHLCDVEHFRNSPTQSYSNDVSRSFPSIDSAVPSACLDDVISDLPFSVPEFDLDPFILAAESPEMCSGGF